MDGNKAKLETGIDEWENREPGSLAGVLNAYAHCIDKINTKQPFTTEDVLIIHQCCIDKVVGTNYDKVKTKSPQSLNTGFRKFLEPVMFQFIPNVNLSIAGCKGAAEYIWKNMIDHEEPYYLFQKVSSANDIKDFLIQYINIEENRPGILPFVEGLTEEKDNIIIPTKIQHVLDNLYKQFEVIPDSPETDDLKISAIVSAIQELEQIHPFQDANCRTFCFVLLNSILMQQGYDPAIIDDPNKFDGFSVEELVETVKLGMQETCKLVDDSYEQKYFSESDQGSDTEATYNGYYYLSDNSESDISEADLEVPDTHYADILTDRLNKLTKEEAVIENFSRIKKELQEQKKDNVHDEEPIVANRGANRSL